MSWIKAVPSSGDDVFDENADDISLLSREWASNMKKRVRVKIVLWFHPLKIVCLCLR